jgi:hypothetical protein
MSNIGENVEELECPRNKTAHHDLAITHLGLHLREMSSHVLQKIGTGMFESLYSSTINK